MTRYAVAAAVALLLLVLALWPRGTGGPTRPPPGPPPVVRVEPRPDGRLVTVRHTLRGSITRAALVYDERGEDRHAAVETDCRKGGDASVEDDGYATVVELSGVVPSGATHLRLVLESETGTAVYPIEP